MIPREKVVHHHPDAPDINFFIVRLALPDLWSHVDGRPTVRIQHLLRQNLTDPEIRQFQHGIRPLGCHE